MEGISEACESLGIPVVGGNVSFYNATEDADIYPTPVVGLLGIADPMPDLPPRIDRAEEGMEVWEIGPVASGSLAGSSLQRVVGMEPGGRPTAPDPEAAREVTALAAHLAHSAPVLHDISDGGLGVALAEICIASAVGARVESEVDLFCEDPHRFLAVMSPGAIALPESLARRVGVIGGDALVLNPAGDSLSVEEIADAWHNAIPRAISA